MRLPGQVVPAEAIPRREEGAASDRAAAGHIRWLDLAVADASAARDFYRQVVGFPVDLAESLLRVSAEGGTTI